MASDAYRAMVAALTAASSQGHDAVADAAGTLLSDYQWVDSLLGPLIAGLAGDPFFDPPFRVSRDRLRISAILFDSPVATLTGTVVDAAALAALPPTRTVVVPGRIGVTRYIRSGGVHIRRWRADPLTGQFSASNAARALIQPELAPCDGAVVRIDGRVEGQLLAGAQSDVVTLGFTVRTDADPLMREYRIADGHLSTIASSDDGASRTEMLLSFLTQANRSDAGPCFEAASRDAAFHTRWSAMHAWLCVDAHAALPRLNEMARDDPHPDVRQAALQTVARIRPPETAGATPCRA
ncbi:MAG: hypothetical protein CMN73_02460 [Sphingomonas sp.]|nr:hypothetical protein [Sphingomonas sp.]